MDPLTPLAILTPPKPIDKMTDEERDAFAHELYVAIEASHKPAPAAPAPTV